jgi:DNA-binding Lrp family transcriptional regulator
MSEERIAMSQKERDWLQWLQQAKQRKITQRTAAEWMGVSERWVRKLLFRMRKKGDRVVIHGLRGKPSARRIGHVVRGRAVRLVRAEYGDFGPTLAAEYLTAEHQLRVSRETLRQWMIAAGIWRAKKARAQSVHTWRARRSGCGDLVQWDTSEHDWLEGRGEKLYLIAMIDDASSRAIARFAVQDSTLENMRLLRDYLQKWGRPLEFYTDQATLFTNAPRWNVELKGPPPKTQIGRALDQLGIGWIAAHSPQAKGRQERFFGTAQDRLVKGMRKAGVSTLAAANAYLARIYLPLWNERFTCLPAAAGDAHRPLLPEPRWQAILSHQEMRVVSNDYTLRWQGKVWQIERSQIRPGLRGGKVEVQERLDGSRAVCFRGQQLQVHECRLPSKPKVERNLGSKIPRVPVAARNSPWRGGLDLHHSRPLWSILRQEEGR